MSSLHLFRSGRTLPENRQDPLTNSEMPDRQLGQDGSNKSPHAEMTLALLAFWIFLAIVLLAPEIPVTDIAAYTAGTYTNIYSAKNKFFGLSIPELMIMFTVLFYLLHHLLKSTPGLLPVRKSSLTPHLAVYFLLILMALGNGLLQGPLTLRDALYEGKIFFYIIIGFFLTTQIVKDRVLFDRTFQLVLALIFFSTLVGLFHFVRGEGFPYGPFLKTLVSGEAMLAFIPIGCYFAWLILGAFGGRKTMALLPMALVPLFLMMAGIAKEMLIYLGIALLIILFARRARARLSRIAFALFVIAIAIGVLQILSSQWIKHVNYLLVRPILYGEEASGSLSSRLLEIRNIWANLIERDSPIQGLGFGVYWRVIYPFSSELHSYPPSDPTGYHKNAHLFMAHFLLKFGLLGVLLYASFIWILLKKGLALCKRVHDPYYKGVTLGLVSAVLPILNIMTYYKLYLFSGVFIGLFSVLIDLKRREEIL